jgi:hypothetical protein
MVSLRLRRNGGSWSGHAPDAAARCRERHDTAEFFNRQPDHFTEPDEALKTA